MLHITVGVIIKLLERNLNFGASLELYEVGFSYKTIVVCFPASYSVGRGFETRRRDCYPDRVLVALLKPSVYTTEYYSNRPRPFLSNLFPGYNHHFTGMKFIPLLQLSYLWTRYNAGS